jgi:hypothetical protein
MSTALRRPQKSAVRSCGHLTCIRRGISTVARLLVVRSPAGSHRCVVHRRFGHGRPIRGTKHGHSAFTRWQWLAAVVSSFEWLYLFCRLWQQRHRHHLLRAGGGAGRALLAGHLRHLPGGLHLPFIASQPQLWRPFRTVFSANDWRVVRPF